MSFTKGDVRDEYAQVYDRLRKRSYRLASRREGARFFEYDSEMPFYGGLELHDAYVRGVKDALAAIVELDDAWIAEAQAMNRRAEAEQDAWDAAHAAARGEG